MNYIDNMCDYFERMNNVDSKLTYNIGLINFVNNIIQKNGLSVDSIKEDVVNFVLISGFIRAELVSLENNNYMVIVSEYIHEGVRYSTLCRHFFTDSGIEIKRVTLSLSSVENLFYLDKFNSEIFDTYLSDCSSSKKCIRNIEKLVKGQKRGNLLIEKAEVIYEERLDDCFMMFQRTESDITKKYPTYINSGIYLFDPMRSFIFDERNRLYAKCTYIGNNEPSEIEKIKAYWNNVALNYFGRTANSYESALKRVKKCR